MMPRSSFSLGDLNLGFGAAKPVKAVALAAMAEA